MAKIQQKKYTAESQPSGNILSGFTPVAKLGICGAPGTKFRINGGSEIEIGAYGIYELDLSNGLGVIASLEFTFVEFDEDTPILLVDFVSERGE